MKTGSVNEIVDAIKGVRIAIAGDFCLDAYWFVDESGSEISVETGLPTRTVREQRYSLGGAGNVAANLAAMGVENIMAFGVIGSDPFGVEMVKIMKSTGISADNLLIQDKEWSTHVYIKPHSGESEESRIDFGNFNSLSDETADRLIRNLSDQAGNLDLVIINQQVLSGIHTEYFRHKIVETIRRFHKIIFITDSRNYTDVYEGSYRKMNDTEASRLCGVIKEAGETISRSEITEMAETLYERFKKPLFITRGDRGSLAIDEKGITEIPGLMILSKTDSVGAGDSYLAGTAAALAAGYNTEIAAELGSYVAGVTVQKLYQTGTASPDEIISIGCDPDYIYHPDLAEDHRHAHYIENTDIEIIKRWKSDLQIRHAIFDHDGTISTMREGWELIMAPMMIRALLGDRHNDVSESEYNKVKSRVNDIIDKTTGIQTLMQMKVLAGLVKEFGYVPDEQILDEHGYKQIYNDDLMQMVRMRMEKLRRGELSQEDLTLKNSVAFLKMLFDKGIRLYLTSGTDEEDVKNEAAVLGYDYLFEGRIYGATGNIRDEAKRILIDNLLDSIGSSEAGTIITFGDGPVEIRETLKRGGYTAGIASNEIRRHGLNRKKRARLIRAGADIIIPDFSQADPILKLMNI